MPTIANVPEERTSRVAAIIRLFASFKRRKDTEWEPADNYRNRKLITGEYEWNHLMRRRVNGEWQYRRMTEEEYIEKLCNEVV